MEDMDGELLVYNPNTATTLHLNGPSTVVWQLLTGEYSLATIITSLQEAYPDQAAQIEPDVIATVSDMLEQGVIQAVVSG
ncbi:coenzyme PQQ synthesis protein D (PqqD) [Arenicella xantha]|uniref:Coenzyme PQQ synthesis protein D (PqqD) n=2 Tax=Arenicella xantha TaxID=644221 RepID=A0A395JVA3_9GAMM|nr:coenzyme PQQ synthesis protein D (PqqD) [Arenicella xantha]